MSDNEIVIDALRAAMYSADIKYRSYKGRGCHDYCFAIEVEHPFTGLLDIVEAVHKNNPDEFQLVLSSLREVHHDNMGHDVILYWPHLKYNGA